MHTLYPYLNHKNIIKDIFRIELLKFYFNQIYTKHPASISWSQTQDNFIATRNNVSYTQPQSMVQYILRK